MRPSTLTRALLALGLLVTLELASLTPAAAKGPFTSVVILNLESGVAIQVSDPGLEDFGSLSNFTHGTRESPPVGQGYELTRGVTQNGAFLAVDRLRYYPPGTQAHGYIFYEGLINGSSEYDGKGYASTRAGDATMDRILNSPPSPNPFLPTVLLVAVPAAASGLVAGILLRRRAP